MIPTRCTRMGMMLAAGVLVGLSLVAGGCATESSTTAVVTGPDGQSREVSTVATGYSPKDALSKAAGVMERLGLQQVEPQGYQSPGGFSFLNSGPKPWPIVADAFSGVAYGKSAANESIEVTANWQGQGNTTVKITTQLAAAQHTHLVALITAELNRAPAAK